MSAPECIRCGTTDNLVDLLFAPYNENGTFRPVGQMDVQFDGVLCKPCVNEVAGREVFRDAE